MAGSNLIWIPEWRLIKLTLRATDEPLALFTWHSVRGWCTRDRSVASGESPTRWWPPAIKLAQMAAGDTNVGFTPNALK